MNGLQGRFLRPAALRCCAADAGRVTFSDAPMPNPKNMQRLGTHIPFVNGSAQFPANFDWAPAFLAVVGGDCVGVLGAVKAIECSHDDDGDSTFTLLFFFLF